MNEKKKITMLVAVILIFIIVIFFAVKCSNQQYSITFDSRGGNKIESQEVKRGEKLEEPEEPAREGYEFLGWYVDDKKFDFSKKIDKNVKLVAKWKKIESETYTVTFDSNGGTTVASKEVNKNEKVSKPSDPTRSGYTFAGWQLDGKDYDFNSTVSKDITLKAVWVKNTTANKTTDTGVAINTPTSDVPLDNQVPSKPNNGNENIGNVTDPNEPEQPVVKTYIVTFNTMNGEVPTTVTVEEGKTVGKISEPTKKGHIFVAWTLNGTAFDFNTPITSDITLVASYEKDQNVAIVENLTQLKEAVDNKMSTIILANDILNIPETIVLDWMVTVDGNGKTLSFVDGVKDGILVEAVGVEIKDIAVTMNNQDENWNGSYAIQVYNGGATLTNVKATGTDAALLVNSSVVTIKGTMDVSGNQFGGIEVSKGKNAGNVSTLKVEGTLQNTTEAFAKPTIWIDGDHTNVTVNASDVTATTEIKAGQTQYYIYPENTNTVTVSTLDEIEQALNTEIIKTIELGANISNINQTITINRAITLNGNGYTLTYQAGVKDGILVNADNTTINDIHIIMNSASNWQGNYGIQVYLAQNVNIYNYTGEKADAALLVNGGTVYLTGTTTVSNNEFGGIEVSPGQGVVTDSLLYINGYLVNDTESYGLPTIWIDGPSDFAIDGMTKIEKDGQAQYYLGEENSIAPQEPAIDETDVEDPFAQIDDFTELENAE